MTLTLSVPTVRPGRGNSLQDGGLAVIARLGRGIWLPTPPGSDWQPEPFGNLKRIPQTITPLAEPDQVATQVAKSAPVLAPPSISPHQIRCMSRRAAERLGSSLLVSRPVPWYSCPDPPEVPASPRLYYPA